MLGKGGTKEPGAKSVTAADSKPPVRSGRETEVVKAGPDYLDCPLQRCENFGCFGT